MAKLLDIIKLVPPIAATTFGSALVATWPDRAYAVEQADADIEDDDEDLIDDKVPASGAPRTAQAAAVRSTKAGLVVTSAAIRAGRLVIVGKTTGTNRELSIGGTKLTTRSKTPSNEFTFRTTYLPPNCKVRLLTPTGRLIVTVANCGPKGVAGAAGPQGVAGPPGPAGLQGPKGDTGSAGLVGPAGGTGPAGPKGETGPKGDAGFAYKGPWTANGSYAPGDVVVADGTAYAALTASTGRAPAENADAWGLLARKGEDGQPGAPGDRGGEGPQGPQGQIGTQGPLGPAGASIKGDKGDKGDRGIPGVNGQNAFNGGYIVLRRLNANGNLNSGTLTGLEAANSRCLDQLLTRSWPGKAEAIQRELLSPPKVEAFLCVNSPTSTTGTCQNPKSLVTYKFIGNYGETGATLTGQQLMSGRFDEDSYFIRTGRAQGTSSSVDELPSVAAAETCMNWTSSSSAHNGAIGDLSQSGKQRWNNGSVSCAASYAIACMVHPAAR